MQVINNNELFTEVSAEESVIVSGGNAFFGSFAFAGFLTDGIYTPAEALATIAVTLA